MCYTPGKALIIVLWSIILLLAAGSLCAQQHELQVQEISRFAFTTHDGAYTRQPLVRYPYVFIPNSYGFQVCHWDSLAGTFTEVANYGVPGKVNEMALWQQYLYLSVRYSAISDLTPQMATLYRVDISDPLHPVAAGQILAGTSLAYYGGLRIVNNMLLAYEDVSGYLAALVCIDPATLEITNSYPDYYRFEVLAGNYVISRPINTLPFSIFSVTPTTGLQAVGTITLPHYPVNSFPRFFDAGNGMVGSQCEDGVYLWQISDILAWNQLSFIEQEFDTHGVLVNGYLVFGNYENPISMIYVYDISTPAQPLLLHNDPYPAGLEDSPSMDWPIAYGSYLFHSTGIYGCLALKLSPDGIFSFAGELYEYPMRSGHGDKYGNYIIQPYTYRGAVCFDVSDPYHPMPAFTLFQGHSVYVRVHGHYLWVSMTADGNYNIIDREQLYDITDLQNPQLLWSLPYSLDRGFFFNSEEPDYVYYLNNPSLTITKYHFINGEVLPVLSYPLPLEMQTPSFVNGILYMANRSGVGLHDLYSYTGWPQNNPNPPTVQTAYLHAPGWIYPAGTYVYERRPSVTEPYCAFFNQQSSFEVDNDWFGYDFRNYVCVGRETGISFYDISSAPTGVIGEDYFLPQNSYTTKLDWDENYIYAYGIDNISIYAYNITAAEDELAPAVNALKCYPNPFGSILSIEGTLTKAGNMSLSIYNIKGQSVKKLHQGWADKGEMTYSWDGRDDSGRDMPSGVYLIKMQSQHGTELHKICKAK